MQTVLVTADAVRADHLGQYGYNRDTMPVLDRIASEGRLYSAAFANGPHSGVSIPSILTGRYHGGQALRSGPSLATTMADAGCRTAAFHSNTMVAPELNSAAGFHLMEDFGVSEGSAPERATLRGSRIGGVVKILKSMAGPRVRDNSMVRSIYHRIVPDRHGFDYQVYIDGADVTDRVLQWLDDIADQPFFCWVHYMDPHRPYGIGPDAPKYVEDSPDREQLRSLMARAGRSPEQISADERRVLVDLYDSDLRYTSTQVDRLLDGIDERVGLDATSVVFTADHGEEFGEHGQYFHGNRPYDELLHVPLAIRQPRHDDGARTVSAPRELVDVTPSLCATYGIDDPTTFDGTPLHTDRAATVFATGALCTDDPVVAVRTPDIKYIGSENGPQELYDLREDPGEQTDVSTANPERVRAMRSQAPETLWSPPADRGSVSSREHQVTRRRLEALGYLDSESDQSTS